MDYQTLKLQHRAEREQWPEALSVRVHRALSWLQRAELCEQDEDAEFLFLWIAFNAAYANDIRSEHPPEAKAFADFLYQLQRFDRDKQLEALVWQQFSGPIRVLLDNPYVFQPFWECQKQPGCTDGWKWSFDKAQTRVSRALSQRDTVKILRVVFSRIYTLRNQLTHGGATWQGKLNREAIRDSVALMRAFVPVMLSIMMASPNQDWGQLHYPVLA
ncbi:HEPN domain-containing protein [Ferrimonas marina]|uniref:Uncharacterized protein n=1 Tax=Ferrimonas marina TaxID=299255 RepID=A0A1M5XBW6_9GAMM|nr:HEPN domain-containing protein [Ferrimonas marina]SHH97310.1 hypothetical protein SAMN02745129_3421 [Ferrimonas marina]